jgi:chromate transport protein ChrA
MFLFFIMMVINFFISWHNARQVGNVWTESKQIGGSMRTLAVSGYIMAIAGFTMVYGCVLILLTAGFYPFLTFLHEAMELTELVQFASDLLYVQLCFMIIPTGIIIGINSVINAWQHRTLSNIATAGWNTFANVHNVVRASRELPGAFSRIFAVCFGGKGKKGKGAAILFIAFVLALALLGGWITASTIMKKADREYDLFEETKKRSIAR